MIAAFTVCSNNYLPQALTLAASVRRHAPEWKFVIGLVDVRPPREAFPIPADIEVVQIDEIGLADLADMTERYNIIELSTAIKPTMFKWLFRSFPEVQEIHYLDPDTVAFGELSVLTEGLRDACILLTPHHYTPIPLDDQFPGENLSLNHGIYNLGYLGLRRSAIVDDLLQWWEDRMRFNCRIDLKEGWFVDQLFFNFVPIYFRQVNVLFHPGVNAAYWNYHERSLPRAGVVEFQRGDWPLILYHFSGFSPFHPERPTRAAVRLDWSKNQALKPLLAAYADELLAHKYREAHQLVSHFQVAYLAARPSDQGTLKPLMKHVKKLVKRLIR